MIDGIQILRGIAALLVAFQHARLNVPGTENWPQFGVAGVDIFFVISGFVMAHTTARIDDKTFWLRASSAAYFFSRRLARICPLYFLAILWTARRELAQDDVSIDLIKDFVFVPHWNYSVNAPTPIIIQGWTLNYEMFFYLLFAGSLLFGKLRVTILIASLVVLAAVGETISPAELLANFYTNAIILEFGYGVLLYHLVNSLSTPPWPRASFLAIGSAAFALIASIGLADSFRAISFGLPALVIVWTSLSACRGWLKSRVLQLLGDSSYAIYLFHWASYGALKPMFAWFDHPFSEPQIVFLMAAHVTTAALSGVAIHLWIERPLLFWTRGCLQRIARQPGSIHISSSGMTGVETRDPAPCR